MSDLPLRSPAAKVRDVFYFGRMLDKIRLHERGDLPSEYEPNLGGGFDELCVLFLRVDYGALVEQVKRGLGDEDILDWCFRTGFSPSANEIYVWNEFMRKRGWNDEITATLNRRKAEAGMADREEIETMFQFIDADESRPIEG
ncbi:MAG: DUF5069 domain-containing protein [Verrucomicrobiota bacterium]|nr:DUF5069 domain-containing protein [Verrucomicrobiota bacterium]